jgi:hypothetical protein
MFTGLLDLIYIPKEKKAALGSGLIHGFINGAVILILPFLLIMPGNLIRLCRPLHLFYYLLRHF